MPRSVDLGHRLVCFPDQTNGLRTELLWTLRLATQWAPLSVDNRPLLGARAVGSTPVPKGSSQAVVATPWVGLQTPRHCHSPDEVVGRTVPSYSPSTLCAEP